jgi:hypothetical protein
MIIDVVKCKYVRRRAVKYVGRLLVSDVGERALSELIRVLNCRFIAAHCCILYFKAEGSKASDESNPILTHTFKNLTCVKRSACNCRLCSWR